MNNGEGAYKYGVEVVSCEKSYHLVCGQYRDVESYGFHSRNTAGTNAYLSVCEGDRCII